MKPYFTEFFILDVLCTRHFLFEHVECTKRHRNYFPRNWDRKSRPVDFSPRSDSTNCTATTYHFTHNKMQTGERNRCLFSECLIQYSPSLVDWMSQYGCIGPSCFCYHRIRSSFPQYSKDQRVVWCWATKRLSEIPPLYIVDIAPDNRWIFISNFTIGRAR